MKKLAVMGALMCALVAGSAQTAPAGTVTLDEAITAAVRDIEAKLPKGTAVAVLNVTSDSERLSEYVIEELAGALVNGDKVVVVDRQDIELVRQEQQFQLSGDVSDESAQSIGKMLGAQSIVSGEGKYEVTVGEFRAFVNATGYRTTAETSGGGGYVFTGSSFGQKSDASWNTPYFSQQESQPVVLVSWYDAVAYCNWRSTQEQLTPTYTIGSGDEPTVTWNRNANGYRLPTEAEWEYACRAGTRTSFSTGNNITTSQAVFNTSSTKPVGSFPANSWGLFDMHGNVGEWCWDWYGNYPSGSQTNPVGASSGEGRVVRGGGWFLPTEYLRSAIRNGYGPSDRINYLGFRLVRSAR